VKKFFPILGLAAVFFAACAPVAAPLADPQSAIETMVAATVAALPTSTSAPSQPAGVETSLPPTQLPTQTPFASITPFPSFTPVPSEVPSGTPTPDAGSEYNNIQGTPNFSCQITNQVPEDWKIYPPSGRLLTVVWEIKNVGVKDWNNQEVRLEFRGGERMVAKGTTPELSAPILAGETGVIMLTFILPTQINQYVSRWALMRGRDSFCEFSFQVNIK